MEGRIHGAEGARPQRLAGAAGTAAHAQAVQPAFRPVRAGPVRIGRLRALVHRARVRARPGTGDRGAAYCEFQGVPAAPATRQLLGRPGDGETAASAIEQLAARYPESTGRTKMKLNHPSFRIDHILTIGL